MTWLKEYLGVLVKQGLVLEQKNLGIATYVITDSGVRVLRFFRVKAFA
jgi:predicted transcriptional regulator